MPTPFLKTHVCTTQLDGAFEQLHIAYLWELVAHGGMQTKWMRKRLRQHLHNGACNERAGSAADSSTVGASIVNNIMASESWYIYIDPKVMIWYYSSFKAHVCTRRPHGGGRIGLYIEAGQLTTSAVQAKPPSDSQRQRQRLMYKDEPWRQASFRDQFHSTLC